MTRLTNVNMGKPGASVGADWWIVVANAYDCPVAFILSPEEIRQTIKLYDGKQWAQGSQFDTEVTRNAWDRILTSPDQGAQAVNVLAKSDAEMTTEFFRTRLSKAGIALQVRTISWNGPYDPVSRWKTVKRFTLDTAPGEIAAVIQAELWNRRFFRICSDCGERNPVGCMSADFCQNCAERSHGIVH